MNTLFSVQASDSSMSQRRDTTLLSALDPRTNNVQTLAQAITAYVPTLPMTDRGLTSRELSRFGRWIGTETALVGITPIDVSRYQEQFSESSVDVNRRLEPVKT